MNGPLAAAFPHVAKSRALAARMDRCVDVLRGSGASDDDVRAFTDRVKKVAAETPTPYEDVIDRCYHAALRKLLGGDR